MTELTELKMNVAALKRVDPYIKDIIETATHVALYTFNSDNNEWEKTDIEGALFVYSRNGEPYNSILIMNRLNTNNLVEPVTQGLDLQLQKPFLLYRNSKSNIYGIWFYDKDECVKVGSILNKLVKESDDLYKPVSTALSSSLSSSSTSSKKQIKNSTTKDVDIFSMLSKAQEDFNINRGTPRKQETGENNIAGITQPHATDSTPQSVMDFFAKAKVNTGHFKAGDQPNQGVPQVVGVPQQHTVAETKPFLARLMSHPAAHTLEHIEKQQRSITPQPQTSSSSSSTTVQSIIPNNNSNNINNNINKSTSASKSKRHYNINKDTTTQLESVSQELQRQTNINVIGSNGTTSFHRIQSPITPARQQLNHNSSKNLFTNDGQVMGLSSTICDGLGGSSSLPDALSTLPMNFASLGMDSKSVRSDESNVSMGLHDVSSTPALMPPVMFSASSPSETQNRPLEPLTRNQLLQAFNYLLKSDPDFMKKLHEAYVKSFSEILS